MFNFSIDDIAKAASDQMNAASAPGATNFFSLDSLQGDSQENTDAKKVEKTDILPKPPSMGISSFGDLSLSSFTGAVGDNDGGGSTSVSVASPANKKKDVPNKSSNSLSSIDVDILINSKTPTRTSATIENATAIKPSPRGMWGTLNTSADGDVDVNAGSKNIMKTVASDACADVKVDCEPTTVKGSDDCNSNEKEGHESTSEDKELNESSQIKKELDERNTDALNQIQVTGDDDKYFKEGSHVLESCDSGISVPISDDGMTEEINHLNTVTEQISTEFVENESNLEPELQKNQSLEVIDSTPNNREGVESDSADAEDSVKDCSVVRISEEDDVDADINDEGELGENENITKVAVSDTLVNDIEKTAIITEQANVEEKCEASSQQEKSPTSPEDNDSCFEKNSVEDVEKSTLTSRILEKGESHLALISSLKETIRTLEISHHEKIIDIKRRFEATTNDNQIFRKQLENAASKMSTMEKRAQLHQSELFKAKTCFEDASGTVDALRTALNASQEEHTMLSQQYDALKDRVKSVATELKERRVECRDLTSKNLDLSKESADNEAKVYELGKKNEELSKINDELVKRNESLAVDRGGHDEETRLLRSKNVELESRAQGLRTTLNSTSEELETSRNKVKSLKESLEKSVRKVKEESEKSLNVYKRKAQAALSSANARAAAAAQAREDAEMEAVTARELVEDVKCSKENYLLMEEQIKAKLKEYENKNDELNLLHDKRGKHIEDLNKDLSELKRAFSSTQAENSSLKTSVSVLERDAEKLRQHLNTAEEDLRNEKQLCVDLRDQLVESKGNLEESSEEKANVRAKITKFEKEVEEANRTIDELKDGLKSALLEKQALEESLSTGRSSGANTHHSTTNTSSNNDSSAPLFYAMEKQAELNAAREEISRLASLLGDAKQERAEAMEAAEIAQKQLESTNSMLLRQEKLGKGRDGKNMPSNNGDSDETSYEYISESADINLEYLKNIMLKYLGAKTYNERRSLIPAIAAVLCLTQDETNDALNSVDLSSGIGNALIDSLSMFRQKKGAH